MNIDHMMMQYMNMSLGEIERSIKHEVSSNLGIVVEGLIRAGRINGVNITEQVEQAVLEVVRKHWVR